MRAKSWLLGLASGAALAVVGACGFQASLELDLSFLPLGGEPLDCDAAGVETVVLDVFEEPDAAPVSTVTRSCRAWRRQDILIAPGRTPMRVRGLNAEGAVCYEDTREVTFERRDSHRVEWVVVQNSGGVGAGCEYP